jgi:hypothetical protein
MSTPGYCGFLTKKGYVPHKRLLLRWQLDAPQ